MTAPEPEYEYAVEWTWRNGHVSVEHGYGNERGARGTLERCSDPKLYNPYASRLMRRPVAEWLPVPQEPGNAK